MRKLTAVALSICTFGIAWAMSLTIAAVQAQDNLQTSIVGVWKLSSFTRKDLQSGEVTNVFGERPVGYLIYTKAGRIFAFLVGSDRKAPNNAEPTDSERAELFKSMVGYTGTYKSKAARSSLEQMRSWIQSWTGIDRPQVAQVVGDHLTIGLRPAVHPSMGRVPVALSRSPIARPASQDDPSCTLRKTTSKRRKMSLRRV